MNCIFLVDPQARNKGSLAIYDCSLFHNYNDNIHYVFYGNSDFGLEDRLNNLRFIPFFNYHKFNGVKRGLSYVFSMFRFIEEVIKFRPMAIHVEWIRFWPIDYIVYFICKKILNVRIIYTVHNILPHNSRGHSDRRKYGKLYALMDGLIVHTSASKSELIEFFPYIRDDKIFVIPHGILQLDVEEDDVKKAMEAMLIRHELSGKTVFAIVGTQSRYKGTDLLLEAWKESPTLSNDNSLCLLVMGKFSKEINASGLPGNVILDNRLVSDEEFIAAIRIASVVVLPYRRIDQSGVLLTLINEHTPYCATNVGELCKPFEIADIGWTIPSSSVQDIQKKLEYLSMHRQEMKEKRDNADAWKKVSDFYSWTDISKKTEALYCI